LEPPPPGCLDLASWAQVLKAWSPEAKIEVLELKSESNSQEQTMHTDSAFMATREGRRYKFTTNEYSMILALEPQDNETYLNVSSDGTEAIKRVVIPQGALMIFRGDLSHREGGYARENRRIYMYIGIRIESSDQQATRSEEEKKEEGKADGVGLGVHQSRDDSALEGRKRQRSLEEPHPEEDASDVPSVSLIGSLINSIT
jgi:hypothetical protein